MFLTLKPNILGQTIDGWHKKMRREKYSTEKEPFWGTFGIVHVQYIVIKDARKLYPISCLF